MNPVSEDPGTVQNVRHVRESDRLASREHRNFIPTLGKTRLPVGGLSLVDLSCCCIVSSGLRRVHSGNRIHQLALDLLILSSVLEELDRAFNMRLFAH